MIVALVIMVAVIVVRIGTIQLLHRMQAEISGLSSHRKQKLDQLKVAQAQHETADMKKTALGRKAAKLAGKIRKLRKELSGYEEEAERKTLKTNELKKQLVH